MRSIGRALALGLGVSRLLNRILLRLAPLVDSLAIPAALLTPALPATFRLPPSPAGTPSP